MCFYMMLISFLATDDHILDGITRHCILHALTVIEAAIFKVRYQRIKQLIYIARTLWPTNVKFGQLHI